MSDEEADRVADQRLRPLGTRTMRDEVIGTLRSAILECVLLPGTQVNQAQIAEQLGISRGPVREALRQLEEEGLIRSIPYKGTFVTEVTAEYIAELYSMRQVLEVFALRRLMQAITPEQLDALRAVVSEMCDAARAGDIARAHDLDVQFHALICQGARHQLLLQAWTMIERGVRRSLALGHRRGIDPHDVVGSHPAILATIEAGDTELACRLLHYHLEDAGLQAD